MFILLLISDIDVDKVVIIDKNYWEIQNVLESGVGVLNLKKAFESSDDVFDLLKK
jgi:hypothetical protein